MTVDSDELNQSSGHILIDATLCSDDALKRQLVSNQIKFTVFQKAQEINTIDEAIDAVVFSDALMPIIIKELGSQTPEFLMLVVLSSVTEIDIPHQIDGILPSQPTALVYQLMRLLVQRSKNQDLQKQLDNLEVDNAKRKRKLREIELLKNAIVRNVSHELRTPLLQVKSAVALIGEDTTDKKLVNYAQNAVSRLETHVKNITLLGHSLDINPNPIILRDAVEYAKRNLTRIWTRSRDAERIHVVIEPHLPPIIADKQGLSTVLQLLMDNALKFGNEKDIEIIGRKSGDKVYVAIRDNGIGIANDQLQDIFESFYQVDDTSTRPYGGAGVGLALVKFILENHGIIIHVESTLNEGSTFWFEIPFVNFDDLS
ncbi:MAG: HAMP domain-containing sensor histidine kinase [Phototrophicaceae bacterium]